MKNYYLWLRICDYFPVSRLKLQTPQFDFPLQVPLNLKVSP